MCRLTTASRPGAFLHRDHRIAGTAARDAIYPFARDPLHYPEHFAAGLAPHKVSELLLWETDDPNCIVDVSGHLESQAAALTCHQSQLPGLDCGEHPLPWLDNRATQTASGCPFEKGKLFRRLLAPA